MKIMRYYHVSAAREISKLKDGAQSVQIIAQYVMALGMLWMVIAWRSVAHHSIMTKAEVHAQTAQKIKLLHIHIWSAVCISYFL